MGRAGAAIEHPATRVALAEGRARAVRLSVVGVAVGLAGLVAIMASGAVGAGSDEGAAGGIALVGSCTLVAGAAAAVDGGLRLRRARSLARALATGPWQVVGPYRWAELVFQAGRRETIVAIARPGAAPLRVRLVGLKPGWRQTGRTGDGTVLWLAGPAEDRWAVGTPDGRGLALVQEPEGLRRSELGRHLDRLEP